MPQNTEIIVAIVTAVSSALISIIHAVTHAIQVIKYGHGKENLTEKQILNRKKRIEKINKKAQLKIKKLNGQLFLQNKVQDNQSINNNQTNNPFS